ncbi:DUF4081 domain-containing protein, partial [Salana multivorans]
MSGGERSDGVIGLVGVGRIAGEATSTDNAFGVTGSVLVLLELIAALNMALFAFNLIPLLPLDGGHLAGALWEMARRRIARWRGRPDPGPIDTARALPLTLAVSALFVLLVVVLVIADLVQPVSLTGGSAVDVRALAGGEERLALDLCARDPVAAVLAAARIEEAGVSPLIGTGAWGAFEGTDLTSLLWVGANLVPVSPTGRGLAALAGQAVQRARRFSSVVGDSSAVHTVWSHLAQAHRELRQVRRQPSLAITAAPRVPGHPGVRPARESEVDILMPASVAMFTEEYGYSPLSSPVSGTSAGCVGSSSTRGARSSSSSGTAAGCRGWCSRPRSGHRRSASRSSRASGSSRAGAVRESVRPERPPSLEHAL